eukprot:TRINITY_DN3392_c0_g1_i1.p1 TRINITY_DN3392_c0_g1~~TRINITY_DN3392_c0_g1_i1.p1  ORF type:complete len:404 (+),score=127.65 TRINITY_DN3392_c0_g1_i1:127-1212(+)
MLDAQVTVQVPVRDARGGAAGSSSSPFTLSRHGFQLAQGCGHSVTTAQYAANDTAALEGAHYREVAAAVQDAVGPHAEVLPYHWTVRSSALQHDRGSLGEATQLPAASAHCDFSRHSAVALFNAMARPDLRRGRFAVVNAWRNVSEEPVENFHLAVCDAGSVVTPDDFVATDVVEPNGKRFAMYSLEPAGSDRHRWWYYPRMARDEMLLFMQYDSDPAAAARYCFHTAVADPTAPAGAMRLSCETRVMVFFPDHPEDTVPKSSGSASGESAVSRVMEEMLTALDYPAYWPVDMAAQMRQGLWHGGSGGPQRLLAEWVALCSSRQEMGVHGLTHAQQGELVEAMLEGGAFEERAKRAFPAAV